MDDRTTHVLDSLDPVSVAFLLQLLQSPATEAELVTSSDDTTQPTGNRRLHRLRQAGLVAQEPGRHRAPGRRWTVPHAEETNALLTALFALSDVIEARDRARREVAKRKLRRARAARLGIRRVGDGG
jgi:hypothetical protein